MQSWATIDWAECMRVSLAVKENCWCTDSGYENPFLTDWSDSLARVTSRKGMKKRRRRRDPHAVYPEERRTTRKEEKRWLARSLFTQTSTGIQSIIQISMRCVEEEKEETKERKKLAEAWVIVKKTFLLFWWMTQIWILLSWRSANEQKGWAEDVCDACHLEQDKKTKQEVQNVNVSFTYPIAVRWVECCGCLLTSTVVLRIMCPGYALSGQEFSSDEDDDDDGDGTLRHRQEQGTGGQEVGNFR